jgi:hypothetical protein
MADFNVLATRSYEDSPGDTYLIPGLSEQKGQAFAPEPADGDNIQVLWTSYVSVHGPSRTSKRMAEGSPAAAGVPLVKTPNRTAVYVTDCRVVLSCGNLYSASILGQLVLVLLGPIGALIGMVTALIGVARIVRAVQVPRDRRRRTGKVMVGQIRYEWIKRIGATPPSSGYWFPTVALEYTDGETTKSVRLHLKQREAEPVLLAQDIARRAAAFRLRRNAGLAPDQQAILEQLSHADILHPPVKELAYYDLPAAQAPRQGELLDPGPEIIGVSYGTSPSAACRHPLCPGGRPGPGGLRGGVGLT